MLTFEPSFVDSEDMFYAMFESDCSITAPPPPQGHEEEEESRKRQREEEPAAAEPVHALSAGKKPKQTAAGIIAGKAKSGAKA